MDTYPQFVPRALTVEDQEDISPYCSLSNYGAQLQQQAHFALQDQGNWQGALDEFLPLDNDPFFQQTLSIKPMSQTPSDISILSFQSALMAGYDSQLHISLGQDSMFDPLVTNNSLSMESQFLPSPLGPSLSSETVVGSVWPDSQDQSTPYNQKTENDFGSISFSPPTSTLSSYQAPLTPLSIGSIEFDVPIEPTIDSYQFQSVFNIPSPDILPLTPAAPTISSTQVKIEESVNVQPIEHQKLPQLQPQLQQKQQKQKPEKVRVQKKSTHNAVERRYRNNINDRISELKEVVPALRHAKLKDARTTGKRSHRSDEEDEDEDGEEYLEGVSVATKLNKATILRKATEYILHLKKTEDTIQSENTRLQQLMSQLPGGFQILSHYRLQQAQRAKDNEALRRQQIEQEKLEQQQRKSSNKKQRRQTKGSRSSDEYETSSSASDPATPPYGGTGQRVFMAVFMAMSFFSSQPMHAGPMSPEQYQNHNHASRTPSTGHNGYPVNNSATETSFLGSFLPLNSGWSMIRTTIFIICIVQIFLPIVKHWCSCAAFKVKRTANPKRVSPRKRNSFKSSAASATTASVAAEDQLTPGDKKCKQIYRILIESLNQDNESLPQTTPKILSNILKESICLFSRHALGYEILYDRHAQDGPQEEWARVCKWIKLNEIECLGGNVHITRVSMLHSCLQMINLVDSLNEDEHDYVGQTRLRAYANAAMEMALIVPFPTLAERLSRYFWRLSMYEACSDDDSVTRSLVWDCREDDAEDRMDVMLQSQAWKETLEVMQHQIGNFGVSSSAGHGLSLSMTAPVLVPVAILSTLHLLDNLQTQFGRLVVTITGVPLTTAAASENGSDFSETTFDEILAITTPGPKELGATDSDMQRLAHWLAAVGATVEALWKSDVETAKRWMATLVQRVPRSLVATEMEKGDLVDHKAKMNQIDELTKRSMLHILYGATLLKSSNEDEQRKGVEELQKAEKILQYLSSESVHKQDIESGTMALAEFVVAVAGLEAWVAAWQMVSSIKNPRERENWESQVRDQICEATITLRRMISRHSLGGLRTNQAIITRLIRLSSFASQQLDEVDLIYEGSEDEYCDHQIFGDNESDSELGEDERLVKRTQFALDILRGLV
ncbi:helix-loop-helix DNA-binding domain-containing transcription factor [Phycomyces blakesleeanus]|uniref:Helix-loop-helix DNA-binding domain-containing transcription factor n=1 Tax=Phycomyces blakesleeanus TaxID=4837 RepID=A0ABR3AZ32_PHYBL